MSSLTGDHVVVKKDLLVKLDRDLWLRSHIYQQHNRPIRLRLVLFIVHYENSLWKYNLFILYTKIVHSQTFGYKCVVLEYIAFHKDLKDVSSEQHHIWDFQNHV